MDALTGTLPGEDRQELFRFIGQIHHTTLRTNVQDFREKYPHYFTDFLRDIRPVFISQESRNGRSFFAQVTKGCDPFLHIFISAMQYNAGMTVLFIIPN